MTTPHPRFDRSRWRHRLMIGLGRRPGGDLSQLGPLAADCLPGARLRYAISADSHRERDMAAAKGYGRLAAVIDAEWPEGGVDRIDPAIETLAQALATEADLATILAGESVVLLDAPADRVMFISAKRLEGSSVEAFRAWWIGDHAALLEDLAPAFAQTYVQLHVDRALSEDLSRRAGIAFRPFDGADSVYFDDAERLFGVVGNERAARLLAQDELRAVDVAAGGLCMIGDLVFDTAARTDKAR